MGDEQVEEEKGKKRLVQLLSIDDKKDELNYEKKEEKNRCNMRQQVNIKNKGEIKEVSDELE
jgi:hypothetical protein